MFGALYEEGISRAQVARTLSLPQSELEQLMFGLMMTGIEGNRRSEPSHGDRPKLSVIKGGKLEK
jgi:hypothetical protein